MQSCSRPCFPSPPSPGKPWCSFPARPTPSNPFPDLHPSSCPLRRLSGSPSSESKLSRSPCCTMRPAVSEQPGWPGGLGFRQAAGAGGCPGQQRTGGGPSGGTGVAGTPPPEPEKTRAGSRQATEAEEGLRAAGGQGGAGAEGFYISWVPFPGARGRSGGRAGKTPRCLLAGFTVESPRAAWGQLRAPRHPHSGHLTTPAWATSPRLLALVLAQMLLAAHLHWFSGARAWRS